jgi:hypothetical protein
LSEWQRQTFGGKQRKEEIERKMLRSKMKCFYIENAGKCTQESLHQIKYNKKHDK